MLRFVAMMPTTFFDVFLTFLVLDTTKSSEMKKMATLHLCKESSNNWSASDHPIYYIAVGMSAT